MTVSLTPVGVPANVKNNNLLTVQVRWRDTIRDELSKYDIKTAEDVFGYTVRQWDDVDKSGRECRLTSMLHKDGRAVWLYATYFFTRVGCKPCKDFRAQSYASRYVLVETPESDPATNEPFPICDTHLDGLRRSLRGSAETTIRVSELLIIGQHD
jgi:hypothetical protein